MATNGSSNDVAIRDDRGRYLKGMPGGPGRPRGSRNKLTEDFFADLHAASVLRRIGHWKRRSSPESSR